MAAEEGGLQGLMDTKIKAKLGIIPANFTWGQQDDAVFDALKPDFMKPRIHEVITVITISNLSVITQHQLAETINVFD